MIPIFLLILITFFTDFIKSSTEKYPVDVCFMVADLKYNAKQGVKICEIQQGSLSMFNGDSFRNPTEGSIYKNLLTALSFYNKNGWIVTNSIADKNLAATLAGSLFWQSPKDIITLLSNPNFNRQAKQSVINIHDLSSYQGFLYISWSQLSAIDDFEKRFPGMIILDKSSFPFWIDKYEMTKLFDHDAILSTFKPKWGIYKKDYSKDLASKIATDLACDTFVIKPRGQFLGKGVIIAQQKELDEVLFYIITKSGSLLMSKDAAYTAWKNDIFESFIVEEFIASDHIKIPHLENKTYQPTMRVAFLLVYNNKRYNVHFLGEYWKTPLFALNQDASFMEKNKDICIHPYYCAVDEKTREVVHNKLRVALPLLHAKMLQYCSHSNDEYYNKRQKKFYIELQ